MLCPKCNSKMEGLQIHDVDIKRCTYCLGLWFERSKHEYLRELDGSIEIDIGNKQTGKAFNKIEDIFCPECAAPMIKMVVADQPHIHYESCSGCFSVFFDAGEFTDYVDKNIFDFFKDILATERK